MKNVRVSIALVAVLFCKLLLLCPHPVMAQTTVVVRNDFEDGTLQGWVPRGSSVVLTNTTEAAAAGMHSLKTAGRTASWNGPSLDVTGKLVTGTLYEFTAWVRLVSGQPADTLKITCNAPPAARTSLSQSSPT